MERRPWKRPIAVGTYTLIFLALFGLGYLSYHSDHGNPGYAAQLIAQQKETDDFMRQPFEAEVMPPSAAGVTPAASPLVAQGARLFQAQSCSGCHGDGGVGTAAGPKLVGIGKRASVDQLTALLKAPNPKMTAGGMTPVDLKPDDLQALVTYVNAL